MLIVTFDEAESGSSTACCNEPTGPNTPSPGINGPGGGRIGAVVLSPFVQGGSVNKTDYNHYSFLRSVEDLFGLDHLGYAGQTGLASFGDDVFNAKKPTPPKPPSACTAARSGNPVSSLRLRGRSLTFRGRRNARIRVTVHFKARRGKVLKRPNRVAACRSYRVKVPKGTSRVSVSGAGRTQRVRGAAH
jgi:hypothetical protein